VKIKAAGLEPEHPELSRSYTNLGDIYVARGVYPTAKEHYLHGLRLEIEASGPDDIKVGVVLNKLGNPLRPQGARCAQEVAERAVAIHEKRTAPTPRIMVSLGHLATWHVSQRRYDEAYRLYERCLAIAKGHAAAGDADIGYCLTNLAAICEKKGDLPAALRLYDQAFPIVEKNAGTDSGRRRRRWATGPGSTIAWPRTTRRSASIDVRSRSAAAWATTSSCGRTWASPSSSGASPITRAPSSAAAKPSPWPNDPSARERSRRRGVPAPRERSQGQPQDGRGGAALRAVAARPREGLRGHRLQSRVGVVEPRLVSVRTR